MNLSVTRAGVGQAMTWYLLSSSRFRMTLTSLLAASVATAAFSPVAAAQSVARVGTGYSDMMVLTVDKTALKADLKTWPEEPTKATTLRSFKIAIGKVDGDKEIEGDNKTPEGIYFAQNHIDGSTLPQKYGTLAIPLDFPNPVDQAASKTGHGIWLHGVDRDQRIEEAKVTEGCVAFYNSDISRLAGWLKSHQGIIVIARDTSAVNAPLDLTTVRQRTLDWIAAWAAREVDQFASFYASDFRYAAHDLASYKEYKKRVFSSYKTMSVKYDNLRVITHPKYAVSFFNQDFHGDERFASIGRKVLYWERGADGQWSIKREIFEDRRFETVSFTDAELALLSDPASAISSEKEKKGPNL